MLLYATIVGFLLGYIPYVENFSSSPDIQELIVNFRSLQHEVGKLNESLEKYRNRDMEKTNLDERIQLEMIKLENKFSNRISNLEAEIMLLQNNCKIMRRSGESHDLAGSDKRFLFPGVIDTTHKTAFSVALTHDVTVDHLQTINYDKIITNLGNAYNSSDGHFIAPIKGLYLLTATVLNIEGHTGAMEIVRNGIQLATMYSDSDDYSMATQTLIVILEQNDEIWVRRFTNDRLAELYGRPNEPYNTFLGVLIYEM